MKSLVCLLIGYIIGSVSPSAILSRLTGTDLRKEGTGNLGATNTILVMGKKLGFLVMAFDIFKSYLAARIAQRIFVNFALAGLLAALGAIFGHIYSVFLSFHGGKGVAALGGMMLFYRPSFFFLLIAVAIVLMLVTNLGVVGPVSAAILFPLLVLYDSGSFAMAGICAAGGLLILLSHRSNVRKILSGEEIRVNSFLHKVLLSNFHT